MKVFLVDDNPIFLASAAAYFSCYPSVEVVGLAHSALEALDRLKHITPEVVLMDVQMPGLDGITAAALIKSRPASPRVFLVTSYDDCEHRIAASRANVDGFISKEDLATAVGPLLECQN